MDDQTQGSAPIQLDAPVAPSGDNGEFTPEDQVEINDWEKAAEDVFDNLKSTNNQEEEDESTKSKEGDEAGKTPQDASKDKKQDAKSGDGDADGKGQAEDPNSESGEESEPPAPPNDFSRLSIREQQRVVNEFRADAREKLFGDVPTELRDADGDPINGVEDVMRLANPRTGGEPFSEDEAVLWLGQAQRNLDQTIASINSQVEQIAETNLMLKDEADIINYEYGEILRSLPNVRDQVWDAYSKTFKTDPKTGYILEAPVSLEQFYRTALEPYAILGRSLEAQDGNQQAETQKQVAEQTRQQRRQDRSDIYGGKTDLTSDDDKEWAQAAENLFGPLR